MPLPESRRRANIAQKRRYQDMGLVRMSELWITPQTLQALKAIPMAERDAAIRRGLGLPLGKNIPQG